MTTATNTSAGNSESTTTPDSNADNLWSRLRAIAGTGDRPVPPPVARLALALEGNGDLDAWSQVDLTMLPRPQPAVRNNRASTLLLTRNSLVFLPVAVTWFAIAKAASAYHTLVADGTTGSDKSFLYLWQNGMEGRLGGLEKLSAVATIDCLLILLIIGLTVAAEWWKVREQAEQRTALDSLDDEWDGLLVDVSLRLAEVAFNAPGKFKDNLGATAVGLHDAARDTREAAETLRTNSEAARAALETQVSLVNHEIAELVRDSATVVGTLGGLAANQADSLQTLTAGQQTAIDALLHVEAALSGVAPALAEASDTARQLLESGTDGFTGAVHDLRSATTDSAALLSTMADRTRTLVDALTVTDDLAAGVSTLRDEVNATIIPLRDEAALLEELVERQRDAVSSAEEISSSLRRIAASVEFGTSQLRADLDAILESLRNVGVGQ